MKILPSTLKTLVIIAIGCYLGYAAYYLAIQRRIMYPRAAMPPRDISASFEDLEKLWLELSSGEVEAWFLPAVNHRNEPAPALIFFHGKRDDIVPYWHAQKLVDTADFGKLISMDCAHNDCPPDYEEFWELVEDFLEENRILASE